MTHAKGDSYEVMKKYNLEPIETEKKLDQIG